MISTNTLQYLENTIKQDYMESLALLKVLKQNDGYEVARWLNRELHDNKRKRIMIAEFLDVLDEYQKECSH